MSVKVGDKIRITNAMDGEPYENGEEYVVTEVRKEDYGYDVWIPFKHRGDLLVCYDEYEVISEEDDSMEKARVGDLIRIVETDDTRYKNGDIFEVVEDFDSEGVFVDTPDDSNILVYDEEYVIHRKAGEEDSTEEASSYYCDTCGDKLGEIACSTHIGGSFCSVKCGDVYVADREDSDVDTLLGEHYDDKVAETYEGDAVNSPNHYTQGKFETIEIIEEITRGYADGYVAYCVGNALKYLARAPFKHGEPSEDLSKAAKYLAFASEYLDAKSTQD